MFEPSRRHGAHDTRWPGTSVQTLVWKAENAEPSSSGEVTQTWDTGAGTLTSDPVARLRAA